MCENFTIVFSTLSHFLFGTIFSCIVMVVMLQLSSYSFSVTSSSLFLFGSVPFSSSILTGGNKVVAKVMFLHMSVSLFTGGCLQRTPLTRENPGDLADPAGRENPPGTRQTPPAGRTPLGPGRHPPDQGEPPNQADPLCRENPLWTKENPPPPRPGRPPWTREYPLDQADPPGRENPPSDQGEPPLAQGELPPPPG